MITHKIILDGDCYATITVQEGKLEYKTSINPSYVQVIEKYIANANAVIASGIALYWTPDNSERDQLNLSVPYLLDGLNYKTVEERIAYAQREIEAWRRESPDVLKIDDRFILSDRAAKFRKTQEAAGNTLYWEYIYSCYKRMVDAIWERRLHGSPGYRDDDSF